jgi:tRNA G10  N-methylase Trm11
MAKRRREKMEKGDMEKKQKKDPKSTERIFARVLAVFAR